MHAGLLLASHTLHCLWLCITALALCAISPQLALAADSGGQSAQGADQSRFLRTALSLQDRPELAEEFATIALVELAEAFIAEADLARSEAREVTAGRDKLLTWAASVDRYSEQLLLVMEDVSLGFPVETRNQFGSEITLMVGGRSVILAHPRATQQPAFEQRVLARFCAMHDCRELISVEEEREPIPVSAAQVSPQWDFSAQRQVCHYQGISVQFSAMGQLARWRTLCRQLLQEALALAAELAWQQRHDVMIEWRMLEIRPTPQRPEHLVLLNTAGDSVLLTLPLMYATPGLLEALLPWVRSRYSGEQATPVSLDARRLGWDN